jgi:hypothetical protein
MNAEDWELSEQEITVYVAQTATQCVEQGRSETILLFVLEDLPAIIREHGLPGDVYVAHELISPQRIEGL